MDTQADLSLRCVHSHFIGFVVIRRKWNIDLNDDVFSVRSFPPLFQSYQDIEKMILEGVCAKKPSFDSEGISPPVGLGPTTHIILHLIKSAKS